MVRWGFTSTKRGEEGRKRQRWEVAFKCVVLFLPPLPPIYSAGTASGDRREHCRIGSGDNLGAPRGNWSRACTRSVRPTYGVSPPLVGPSGSVFSLGGCQVGPQGGSKCPSGLEAVWTCRWAIGSMWSLCGGFWFVVFPSHGLMTSWIQWTHTWQPLIGWTWITWSTEVCFLLFSCAKYLHSSLHFHQRMLSV
jgi:hypothetical protein